MMCADSHKVGRKPRARERIRTWAAAHPREAREWSTTLIGRELGVSHTTVLRTLGRRPPPTVTRYDADPPPLPEGVVCRYDIAVMVRLHLARHKCHGIWRRCRAKPETADERLEFALALYQVARCRHSVNDSARYLEGVRL